MFQIVITKNVSLNRIFNLQYTDASWNYLLLDIAAWWGCISMRRRSRGKRRGTDEKPLSDKPPLIPSGGTYST